MLPEPAEVVVIAPSSSPVHTNPPLRHPVLRWVPTIEPGKFSALQAGAAAADGDVFVLVDADVMVDQDAFTQLLAPMTSDRADVVAGRIDVLRRARTRVHRVLERWSSVSMTAWDLFRQAEPQFRWALPGAIYALKREFLPRHLLVPLVDDASIGMHAATNGAVFGYAPDAVARTPAPATYAQWTRQKFRSRRGWAALAQLHGDDVAALERAFRRYLTIAAADEPMSWLMHTQDQVHRAAARASLCRQTVLNRGVETGKNRRTVAPSCPARRHIDHAPDGLDVEEPAMTPSETDTAATVAGKDTVRPANQDGFRYISDHLTDIDTVIRENGLERHVYDLETAGYTIIENALTAPEVQALTTALLTAAGEDDGQPVDALGATHEDRTQEVMLLLARGGRPFEQLVLHPVALPLITYLLGASCTISSVTGYVKGRGDTALGVHSDTAYVPDPLPPYAQLANVNYCLTDYTEADGCLTIVPGSHRYCHRPRGGDGAREAVPIEARAGSAIVFHGNTWHGAEPRRNSGLRLTLSTLYCRMYMRPQEHYENILGSDVLDRNPVRFRELIGIDVPTGWQSPTDAQRIVGLRKKNAGRYYRTRGQHA